MSLQNHFSGGNERQTLRIYSCRNSFYKRQILPQKGQRGSVLTKRARRVTGHGENLGLATTSSRESRVIHAFVEAFAAIHMVLSIHFVRL